MKVSARQTQLHYRRSIAEIDLRRLEKNFSTFCSLAPKKTFVCPMVKANAYGHGDVEVAQALRRAGAKALGVALVEEGESLRRSGDRDAILVFGPVDSIASEALFRENLTPVASGWDQLEALENAHGVLGLGRVGFHVEFNTGMNRLGFEPSDAPKLRQWLADHPAFRLDGICTHLFSGNDAGESGGESDRQLECFAGIAALFQDLKNLTVHALNSSASVNLWKRLQEKKNIPESSIRPLGLRPGIGIYGVNPGNNEHASIGLQPVMTIKSHIANLHRIETGQKVSYGPTYTASRPSVIATLPLGYADGYRRGLSNKSHVLLRGSRVPQVGTICMDYLMIDVTDLEKSGAPVKLGEEVVLLGSQGNEMITADQLAALAGTIAYEILTGLSERVPRMYLK